MRFKPSYFNPKAVGGRSLDEDGLVAYRAGEDPEDLYVYDERTLLALNVALATGRPLLISGEPGCGKSTLAANAADVLGWWYYKQMVTSRTQASDLLWTFDALKRLNDANLPGESLEPDHYYVEPGSLWWALEPESARQRGRTGIPDEEASKRARDPGRPPSARRGRPTQNKAVLLLDEIDKADPDVPNDLLEALDLREFTVRETNDRIEGPREVLLILTTNGERELPPAFMRRCVSLTLAPPEETWFVGIADQRYGEDELHRVVAREVIRHRAAAKKLGHREPSTGEYLDALNACRNLDLDPTSDVWTDVALSVLWKHETLPDLEEPEPDEA